MSARGRRWRLRRGQAVDGGGATTPLPEATAMMFLTLGSNCTPRNAVAGDLEGDVDGYIADPGTPLTAAIRLCAGRRSGWRGSPADVKRDVAPLGWRFQGLGADEIFAGRSTRFATFKTACWSRDIKILRWSDGAGRAPGGGAGVLAEANAAKPGGVMGLGRAGAGLRLKIAGYQKPGANTLCPSAACLSPPPCPVINFHIGHIMEYIRPTSAVSACRAMRWLGRRRRPRHTS